MVINVEKESKIKLPKIISHLSPALCSVTNNKINKPTTGKNKILKGTVRVISSKDVNARLRTVL